MCLLSLRCSNARGTNSTDELMIKKVRINADLITDWDSFHDIFKINFGFPDFYGRNMDAWIDCMTDIDDKEIGMTKIWINKTDTLVSNSQTVTILKKGAMTFI